VKKNAPCSPAASTCPWRPGRRSSHQSQAGQQQPRPVVHQNLSPTQLLCNITYDSEILKRPSSLNVLKSLLQLDNLSLNLTLGLLSVLNSLGFKGVNGLNLAADVVGDGLEGLEVVLDLVDDGLVLQDVAVLGEVDALGLLGKELDLAARIVVTLLEGLEGGGCLTAETEGAGHLGPVDFESGTALEMLLAIISSPVEEMR